MPSLEQALSCAGLSEKEALVYLAALELGASSAVQIARKTGINRGTTYLIAENLMSRGLMSSYELEGRRLFSAEPPSHLVEKMEKESQTVEDRRRSLSAALPELEALVKCAGPRPAVRYYEGAAGLEAMRQMLYRSRYTEILSAIDLDAASRHLSLENWRAHQKKMKLYDVGGRVLYTCSDPSHEKVIKESLSASTHEHRRVDREKFPFVAETVILDNALAMVSYGGSIMGTIIEHRDFAETARSLFNLAWGSAK